MSAPTPTAGRPGRIVTVADHERWQETHADPHRDEEGRDIDLDGLLTEIRQAEPSTDGIKPSRLQ
jgi:hypothetical protein